MEALVEGRWHQDRSSPTVWLLGSGIARIPIDRPEIVHHVLMFHVKHRCGPMPTGNNLGPINGGRNPMFHVEHRVHVLGTTRDHSVLTSNR